MDLSFCSLSIKVILESLTKHFSWLNCCGHCTSAYSAPCFYLLHEYLCMHFSSVSRQYYEPLFYLQFECVEIKWSFHILISSFSGKIQVIVSFWSSFINYFIMCCMLCNILWCHFFGYFDVHAFDLYGIPDWAKNQVIVGLVSVFVKRCCQYMYLCMHKLWLTAHFCIWFLLLYNVVLLHCHTSLTFNRGLPCPTRFYCIWMVGILGCSSCWRSPHSSTKVCLYATLPSMTDEWKELL